MIFKKSPSFLFPSACDELFHRMTFQNETFPPPNFHNITQAAKKLSKDERDNPSRTR